RIRPQPADTAAGLGHQLVERGRQRAGIHLELAHLVGDGLDLGTRQVDARAVAAAEDARGRERNDAADQHHHQDDLDQAEAALRTAERLAVNDAVATADTSESPAPGAVPLRTAGRLAENDAVAAPRDTRRSRVDDAVATADARESPARNLPPSHAAERHRTVCAIPPIACPPLNPMPRLISPISHHISPIHRIHPHEGASNRSRSSGRTPAPAPPGSPPSPPVPAPSSPPAPARPACGPAPDRFPARRCRRS